MSDSDDITSVGRRGFLGGLVALGAAPKVVGEALVGGEKGGFATGVGKIVKNHTLGGEKENKKESFYDILKEEADGYYRNRISLPVIWREQIEVYEKTNPHVYTSYKEAYELLSKQYKSFSPAILHDMAEQMERNTDYDVWFESNRIQAWVATLDIWEKRLDTIPILKLKDPNVQRCIVDSYRYLMDNSDINQRRYRFSSVIGSRGSQSFNGFESETNMLDYVRKNPEKYPNIIRIDNMFGDIIKNWL